MRSHAASFALLLALAGAACVGASPPASLTGAGQSLEPSIWDQATGAAAIDDHAGGEPEPIDRFRLTIATRALPHWRVLSPRGEPRMPRCIEIVAGRRVEWAVRCDRAVTIEIPAMRVRQQIEPGTPKTFWFLPTAAGEYDVQVRAGQDDFDGKLVVVAAPGLTETERAAASDRLPPDASRLAAVAALRETLVSVLVGRWRPTGRGEEIMRWLVPIPVAELRGLDPLLASAERLVDPPRMLGIGSIEGVLRTRDGVHRFRFTSLKDELLAYRLALDPVDTGAGSERVYFEWKHDEGRRLWNELQWLVEAYADQAMPTGETQGGPWFR